jgi:uncharacterized protein with HEPN domain
MSNGRELSDYLDDIITAIADTAEFTQGMSYEMFAADKKTVNAVIRCLEVLGEAAKHIPTSFRKKHPDLSPPASFHARITETNRYWHRRSGKIH